MKSLTRVLFAIVLLAGFGVRLDAQAPLTNAQLLAKVTALEQEVARLTALCGAPCVPAPVIVSPGAGRPQSLGEAAAEAAKVKHEWATVNAVPRFDPAHQPAPVALDASPSTSSSVPSIGTPPGSADEAVWKNRMRALRVQLDNDRTSVVAAKARVASLQADLATVKYVIQEATVKKALFEAQAELSRLTAAVTNDERAVSDLEIEAKRANVPPGWLVIK